MHAFMHAAVCLRPPISRLEIWYIINQGRITGYGRIVIKNVRDDHQGHENACRQPASSSMLVLMMTVLINQVCY
jgi:hypothetical protein